VNIKNIKHYITEQAYTVIKTSENKAARYKFVFRVNPFEDYRRSGVCAVNKTNVTKRFICVLH